MRSPNFYPLDQAVAMRRRLSIRAAEQRQMKSRLQFAYAELQESYAELSAAEEELRSQNDELMATQLELEAERIRFKDLFDSAPDGYLVTKFNGTILSANTAAGRMLNVEAEFLRGKPLSLFISHKDQRLFSEHMAEAAESIETIEFETLVQPRNQRAFDASVAVYQVIKAELLRKDEHDSRELRWLLRDISELKRSRQQLQQANEELEARVADRTAELAARTAELTDLADELRLKSEALASSSRTVNEILESISDGFLALDREWRFIYVNRRAAENIGHEPQELIGKNIWQLFPGLLGTDHERYYCQVMQSGEPASFELCGVLTGGCYRIQVYPSDEGITVYWLDISEQRRAEEERAQESTARAEAEQQRVLADLQRERLLQENQQQKAQAERQRARAESQRALLETLFNTDPSGLAVIVGPDLRFELANPAYQAITPHPDLDPVGKFYDQIWPPEEELRGKWLLQRALETGNPFDIDSYAQEFPDGSTRYFTLKVRPIEWNGEPAALMVLWDTTAIEMAHQIADKAAEAANTSAAEARHRAEEAEEGRRILDAILQYLPEGLVIADAEGERVRRISRYGAWMVGLPGEELEDLTLEQISEGWQYYFSDGKTAMTGSHFPLYRSMTQGEVIENEEIVIVQAERSLPLLCNAGPIRGENGEITGAVMAWKDITERKQAEQLQARLLSENRQQRRLLERLVREAPVGIALLNIPEYRYSLINPAYEALSGKGWLQGLSLSEVWGEEAVQFTRLLEEVVKSGQSFHAVDMSFDLTRYGNSREAFFTFTYTPLLNEMGEIDSVLVLIQETTNAVLARKQAESERALLKALFDNAPQGIVVSDVAGEIILTNPAVDRLFARPQPAEGESPDESTVTLEIYSPSGEIYEQSDLPLMRAMREGQAIGDVELELRWPDGQSRPLLVNAAPIPGGQGEPSGAVGIFQDITARKQAEAERQRLTEQIEQERDKLLTLIESISDEVWFCDPEGKLALVNSAGRRGAGIQAPLESLQAVGQVESGLEIYQPDGKLRPIDQSPLLRSLRGERVRTEEILRSPESGEPRHREVRSAPIYTQNGELLGAVAVYRDITELKRAEQRLRESEQRFRLAIAAAPVLVYATDREQRYTWFYSPGQGFTQEQVIGRRDDELMPYPDVAELVEFKQRVLDSGSGARQEIRIRSTQGEFIYEISAEPVRADSGKVTGLTVAAYDVTGRKRLEERLAYQALVLEHVHDAVIATDRQYRITSWNRAAEELYSWQAGEVLGRDAREIIPYQEQELFESESMRQMLEDNGFLRSELVQYRQDGWPLYVETTIVALRDGSGQITGYVNSNRDMTDRRLAEEALRMSEQRERARAAELEALMDAVPAMVIVAQDAACRLVTGNRTAYQLLNLPHGSNLSMTPGEESPKDYEVFVGEQPIEPVKLPLQVAAGQGVELHDVEEQIVLDTAKPGAGAEEHGAGAEEHSAGVEEHGAGAEEHSAGADEHSASTPKREFIHLFGNITPLLDEQGSPRGAVAAFIDVTRLKKVEQALRAAMDALQESETRLRSLVDADIIGVLFGGEHGRITEANQAFLNLVGYTRDDLLAGRINWREMTPVEYLERDERGITEANRRGACTPYEKEFLRKDGKRVPVLIGYAWVQGQSSIEYICFVLDLTSQKEAQAAVKLYAEKLERSNRDLQDFAFVASHDLQEPLRKVQAFGDRLVTQFGEQIPEPGRDYLARMQKATTRMQDMINGLLSYSRVTTKARPFAKVNLNQVVHEVLLDLEVRIDRTHGRVEVGELPELEADPLQMRQLFQNLIGNALKFHREGVAPVVRIYVSDQRIATSDQGAEASAQKFLIADRRSQVAISIEDNGIGFDEQYIARLFQPFQRLNPRSVYEGTGIGLAICRKIVERHGGSITAYSRPAQGSTFVISLPIRQDK